MECPSCAAPVAPFDARCPSCDAPLDARADPSALDGLEQDEAPTREYPTDAYASSLFGGDALILGDLGVDFQTYHGDTGAHVLPASRPAVLAEVEEEAEAFLDAATGSVERVILPAPVYIDEVTAALLRPDAIPSATGLVSTAITPIEEHILRHIDGQRPVARIRELTALDDADLRIALAMLSDRKLVRLVGIARVTPRRTPAQADAAGGDAPPLAEVDGPTDFEVDVVEGPLDSPRPISLPSMEALAEPGDGLTDLGIGSPFDEPDAAVVEDRAPLTIVSDEGPSTGPPSSGAPPEALLPRAPAPRARAPAPPRRPTSTPARATAEAPPGRHVRPAMTRGPVRRAVLPVDKPREVALYEQAAAREARGDSEGAIALLRRALEVSPDAAPIHNRLGVLLAVRCKRYREAVDHLLRAVEIDPDNGTFQSNLSKVMARMSSEGTAVQGSGRVADAVARFLTRKLF